MDCYRTDPQYWCERESDHIYIFLVLESIYSIQF